MLVMPPPLIPKHMMLDNYRWLAEYGHILRWSVNSVFVAVGLIGLSVTLSATAGYAFAFYKFPLKKAAWLAMLAGVMIPRISLIIPLFVVVRKLHLSGTLFAVILPVAFTPIGLYLARMYFETVPKSMLECARIDGANEVQVLAHVVAPISAPIIATLALFAAVYGLQDYLWQMLQLQSDNMRTLIVGITRAVMQRMGDDMQVNPLGRAMAGGTILVAPLLVVFSFANRYFVEALGGAVKE